MKKTANRASMGKNIDGGREGRKPKEKPTIAPETFRANHSYAMLTANGKNVCIKRGLETNLREKGGNVMEGKEVDLREKEGQQSGPLHKERHYKEKAKQVAPLGRNKREKNTQEGNWRQSDVSKFPEHRLRGRRREKTSISARNEADLTNCKTNFSQKITRRMKKKEGRHGVQVL